MVRFEYLKVKGLYSFKNETTISCDTNNLIIGPNNSGKTNIFRLFRLIVDSMINPYNIKENAKYKMKADTSVLEFKIHLSESDTIDIANLMILALNGSSNKPLHRLGNLREDFKKLRDFTIKIEYLDTGEDRLNNLDILCSIDTTDLQLFHPKRHSPQITTKNFISSYNDNAPKIDSSTSFIEKIESEDNVEFETFGLSNLIEYIDAKQTAIQLRGVEGVNLHDPDEIRMLNKLKTKYNYKEDKNLDFFGLIGKMLQSNTSYISDKRNFDETPQDVKEWKSTESLTDSGSNLTMYLYKMKNNESKKIRDNYFVIQEQFSKIFTNKITFETFDEVEKGWDEKNNVYGVIKVKPKLVFYIDEISFTIDSVGSGIVEILFLLTKSRTEKNSIILMDEPALHLHPIQTKIVMKQIIDNANDSKTQLFIISHSVSMPFTKMLSSSNAEIIYVRMMEESTIISQPKKEEKEELTSYLPKLEYDLNPELFFAKVVILVEGDTEIGLLQGLDERLKKKSSENDIIFFPAESKDNFPTFVRLLETFGIPYVIMADKDALVHANAGKLSRILDTIKVIKGNDLDEFVKTLGDNPLDMVTNENKCLKRIRKDFSDDDSVMVIVEKISSKYSDSKKNFKDELFKKLNEYGQKYRIYVIQEGEIEDLMQSIDSKLYDELRSKYKGRTRLFAKKFVKTIDEEKLSMLDIPKQVLDSALKLI